MIEKSGINLSYARIDYFYSNDVAAAQAELGAAQGYLDKGSPSAPHPAETSVKPAPNDSHGPGDRDPVGGGQSLRAAEAEYEDDHSGEEQPIDGRDIDLTALAADGEYRGQPPRLRVWI